MYQTIQQTLLLAATATLLGTALAAPTTPLSTTSSPAALPAPALRARDGADSSYMAIVLEWRATLGLSALAQDPALAANAQKTVDDGNGQMVHELNTGTYGQVLAPGATGEFEHVFVGGWLCEEPSLPGLDGICDTDLGQGWYYDGQTGHAEILTSPSYSRIGCANAVGIWACDLA